MDKYRQQNMILNENIWSTTWKLSWPAVIAMVLFGLNVIFDAIFVGRYVGETAYLCSPGHVVMINSKFISIDSLSLHVARS